ncbi:dipeptidase [Reinekea forsetii]|nr:dipeptidase [Reinekea forsetii]
MKVLKWAAIVLLSLLILIIAVFVTVAPTMVEKSRNTVAPHDPYPVSPQAKALHANLVVADLHADSTLWNRDLLTKSDYGHVDVPRMIEGNQALQVFTTVTKTPAGMNYDHNRADARDNITLLAIAQLWPVKSWTSLSERALYQASKLHDMERRAPELFRVIETKKDLENLLTARAIGRKVVGGLIGTEGSHALEGDLGNIDRLYQAGFRMMSLHHFFDNRLGGSLHGSSNEGLTDFGEKVVKQIDQLGIVLDLSHSSEAVVIDTLKLTKNPVVVSHTGTHGHCDSPRNISDSLMRRIANTGGVIGIGFWDAICDYTPSGIASAIQAAINLVGEDHVGLGSDFDGSVNTTLDASEYAAITHELLQLGLSEATIAKVMGGNIVRVFSERLPE